MITTLSALLATKYGKYVLEVTIIAALVFGAYKWAEHRGREAQRDKDEQQTALQIEKDRKEASDLNNRLLQQANSNAAAAESRAEQAQQRFSVLASQLSTLNAKSEQGREQVSKLSDSELHADIVAKLGIRAPADQTPGYTAQEERSIDNTVTQYPIEIAKNKTLSDQVRQKDAEAKANLDLANARQQAFQADESYIGLLNKYYAEVFNQHAPHKRAPKCLWLWGCGRVMAFDPPKR